MLYDRGNVFEALHSSRAYTLFSLRDTEATTFRSFVFYLLPTLYDTADTERERERQRESTRVAPNPDACMYKDSTRTCSGFMRVPHAQHNPRRWKIVNQPFASRNFVFFIHRGQLELFLVREQRSQRRTGNGNVGRKRG